MILLSSFSRIRGSRSDCHPLSPALSVPYYVASYKVNIFNNEEELQNLGTVGTEA